MTRRLFLTSTMAGLAGAGLGIAVAPERSEAAPSDETIRVAHIGVGGMGNAHLEWFAGFPDVETMAVCDVDSTRADAALARLKELRPESKAVAVSDFRRLLDRKDIDVITYATPDHWHALNAILAFQAGKHVYGEKPLCNTIAEAKAMQKICHQNKRIFQLGTQIHAGDNYHRVVELVRAGVIGKVHTVRLWKVGGNPVLGFPKDEEPPATLNWDMWLGPAPWRKYNPAIHPFRFRYYWDYSGGVFADFWCHVADLACWALDLGAPKTVIATGEEQLDDLSTTPPFMNAEFEFPGLKLYWHSRTPDLPGANGRGLGIQFVGDKGEIVADYGDRLIFLDGKQSSDIPEVPQTLPRSPGHQRNFLDCVKSGGQPESNIDYVTRMTLPMHMAFISYRLGRKLTWDAVKEEFVGDEAANRMRRPAYRSPWSLPKI
ncbi:MAG: Gfo/Idh/MocA family oxidoreductase [Armatimonadetes bacterium]|nr:Gfo/Idh/MocA family oxidoreductase [Armatimonadota bacterium]